MAPMCQRMPAPLPGGMHTLAMHGLVGGHELQAGLHAVFQRCPRCARSHGRLVGGIQKVKVAQRVALAVGQPLGNLVQHGLRWRAGGRWQQGDWDGLAGSSGQEYRCAGPAADVCPRAERGRSGAVCSGEGAGRWPGRACGAGLAVAAGAQC